MNDIKEKSKRSKLGFLIRLIGGLIIIGLPVYILSPEIFSIQSPNGPKLTFNHVKLPVSTISLGVRLFILLVAELQLLILVVGLFAVAKILDMFANERWFLPDFSKHLKTFGISLIIFTLSSGVAYILYTIANGYEVFQNLENYKDSNLQNGFEVSGGDLLIILIGIVLITVSKVLKRASENANELQKIV